MYRSGSSGPPEYTSLTTQPRLPAITLLRATRQDHGASYRGSYRPSIPPIKIFAFSFILALEFVFQLQLALLVRHCSDLLPVDADICEARLVGKNRLVTSYGGPFQLRSPWFARMCDRKKQFATAGRANVKIEPVREWYSRGHVVNCGDNHPHPGA